MYEERSGGGVTAGARRRCFRMMDVVDAAKVRKAAEDSWPGSQALWYRRRPGAVVQGGAGGVLIFALSYETYERMQDPRDEITRDFGAKVHAPRALLATSAPSFPEASSFLPEASTAPSAHRRCTRATAETSAASCASSPRSSSSPRATRQRSACCGWCAPHTHSRHLLPWPRPPPPGLSRRAMLTHTSLLVWRPQENVIGDQYRKSRKDVIQHAGRVIGNPYNDNPWAELLLEYPEEVLQKWEALVGDYLQLHTGLDKRVKQLEHASRTVSTAEEAKLAKPEKEMPSTLSLECEEYTHVLDSPQPLLLRALAPARQQVRQAGAFLGELAKTEYKDHRRG
jgi:hypothetical protein